MRALKALREGAIAPFSGFAWPTPASGSGEWVDAIPAACATGVHGCTADQLPLWLQDELWEIELGGRIERLERKLVAERGRLVRRIDPWDSIALGEYAQACLDRLEALAEAYPEARSYARDGKRLQHSEPLFVAFAAARAAELVVGGEAYDAERAWQADWLAERLELVS